MKVVQCLIGLLLLLVLYLLLWPVAITPLAWQAPSFAGYKGVFAENSLLADYQSIDMGGLHGAEAIVTADDGMVYASTHEGWIVYVDQGASKVNRWLNLGPRPLGLDFDAQGNLWVANAFVGLQKISVDGDLSLQVSEADNTAIRYADDVAVAPSGKIYFSDATTRFSAAEVGDTLAASLLDILEHGRTGRVIEFDPVQQTATTVLSGLNFANGVAVSPDGSFLLVAETGAYRIWKLWLSGERSGESDIIIDNLPGFPDNIHVGLDGRYWVGLTSERNQLLDKLADKPFMRKVVQRLPAFLRPTVQSYGHVFAIDGDGKVLISLQDPSGSYPATTGVWETKDYLYVSSLTASEMARISKSAIGL